MPQAFLAFVLRGGRNYNCTMRYLIMAKLRALLLKAEKMGVLIRTHSGRTGALAGSQSLCVFSRLNTASFF